jgi:hypothetical protein
MKITSDGSVDDELQLQDPVQLHGDAGLSRRRPAFGTANSIHGGVRRQDANLR